MKEYFESIGRKINALFVKDFFAYRMFLRSFFPALVAAVSLGFADIADSVVLGQHMGVTGLAAISLVLPIFMVINIVMHGLGIGGCIVFSNFNAQGKKKEAMESFQGVIVFSILIGVILAILGNVFINQILIVLGVGPEEAAIYEATKVYGKIIISNIPLFFLAYVLNYYLRNDNCEKFAHYAFSVGNVVDIILNITFVLGFNMGVKGAGYATIIGLIVMIVIYGFAFITKKSSLTFEGFKPDIIGAVRCFALGFSSSVNYLFVMLFLLVANNLLINLSGGTGVAVLDVVQSVSFIVTYIFDAICKSEQPIVSTYNGEQNIEGKKWIYRFSIAISTIIGIALTIVLFIIPRAVARLFGLTDPDVVDVCCQAIRLFSLGLVFVGSNMLIENYYQSCMMDKAAYIVSIVRSGVIMIPAMFFCSLFGIRYVWIVYPLTEVLTYIIIKLLKKHKIFKSHSFDTERIYRKMITNSDFDMGQLLDEINLFCEKWDASIKQTYFVTMTVEEMSNVILTKSFSNELGFIQITLIAYEDGTFEFHFRDSADKFNPFSMYTAKASHNDEFDMDAMGILMIKKKAKDFSYRNYQGFNTLVVTI